MLESAWARRELLHADPDTTVYRLFHGHGDGAAGFTVDRFGDGWVATGPEAWLETLPGALREWGRVPAWVVGRPKPGRHPPFLLLGEEPPSTVVVEEHGLRFDVEPYATRNGGLYLDARPARQWLREHTDERLILNLFAYTGSLGVAAAAGGARGVTHLEMQKRPLKRARRNHELNGQRVDGRDFVLGDLYGELRRMAKGSRRYEGIIVDPPPQVPDHASRRPAGQDYATLTGLALGVLAPGGWLLCTFNRRGRPLSECERDVVKNAGCPLEVLWRGQSGVDFPEDEPDDKLRFTVFARP